MRPINIAAGFDENFAQHARVMLQSVLDSNPQEHFSFYLLVPPTFSETRRLMEMQSACRCDVHVIPVSSKYVTGVKVSQLITEAAYYRLLMADLLPKHVTRVLYLDSDVLVRGDLRPLWETDLQGFVVGAVRDEIADKDPQYKTAIGLSDNVVYFNSGVLLIDLDRWRRHAIGRKAIEFSLQYPNRVTHDQCALNGCLQGRYLQLDDRWNLQSGVFSHRERVPELLKRAVIIHFTGNWTKPWLNPRRHPLGSLYLQTLKKTSYYTPAAAFRWRCNMLWRTLKKFLGSMRRFYRGFRQA